MSKETPNMEKENIQSNLEQIGSPENNLFYAGNSRWPTMVKMIRELNSSIPKGQPLFRVITKNEFYKFSERYEGQSGTKYDGCWISENDEKPDNPDYLDYEKTESSSSARCIAWGGIGSNRQNIWGPISYNVLLIQDYIRTPEEEQERMRKFDPKI